MFTNQHLTSKTAALFSLSLLLFLHTIGAGPAQAGAQPPTPLAKSPAKAVRTSLLSTVIPVVAGGGMLWAGLKSDGNYEILTAVGAVTGFLGVTVGPSVGHSYAESAGKGAAGIGIRLATSLTGSLLTFVSADDFVRNIDGRAAEPNHGARIFGVMLLGVTTFSAVHDIITSGRAAKEYNRRHGFTSVRLGPTYFANSDAPGLALHIGF